MDYLLVEILEQQDLSLIRETRFVVVVKLEENDKHFEELMVLDDWFEAGKHVDIFVNDEVLHMLVSMIEKNELIDELMIVVVDTKLNLTEFDN
ncbi:hypothetical protein Tco_0860842 [Tanacetum coccineum]|uniref:Uncharacterized protein n=1 Tax=Tanacetum coccineum TaxID=301880 RepID=A0ABQ5BG49_9ASTR